jgi:hypothetical protein
MTKVTKYGYTDTPIDGVTDLKFDRGLVNIKQDFRVKSNSGKEAILTNITSPIDRPENIRIAFTDVADVYKGSNVEPSVFAPSKRGVSVLVQVTDVLTVTDDTDADYKIDLPLSFHLVVKVPNSEYVTADVVKKGLGRLLSSLYDTGSISNTRLEAILRGSLIPSEL